MIVKQLRRKVNSLEKELEKLKKLVGLQAINLCKSDNRMKLAMQSLVAVFQAANDNSCEEHSKASFLLCQVNNNILQN
jgi:hypothetical protein